MPRKHSQTHIPGFGFIYQPAYKDRQGETRRSQVWWMRFATKDGRISKSTGRKDQAEAFIELMKVAGERAHGRILESAPERVRIGQLLDMLIDSYEGKKTLYDLTLRVKKHLSPIAGMLAVDLNRAILERLVKEKRKAGLSPASINRCLANLHRAFEIGKDHDLVNRIPSFPWQSEKGNERQGIMQPDTYRALRNALPAHAALVLVIGYHTGMRRGEILSLRWEQIDLAAGNIRLSGKQTKTAAGRNAPIYGEMASYLEMARAERDSRFPNCSWVVQYRGKRVHDIKTAWNHAREASGGTGMVHDLRRTALTNMEEAGIARSVAMAISGHKTESAYRRYLIGSQKRAAEAGKTMERFFAEREGKGEEKRQ